MNHDIIKPLSPKVVSEEGNKGVYEIDSLHPGYGHTIGNSLRRVLLSSLPGAAITSIKIEGTAHEFSTIAHVKEDVIGLILNLKQARFLMHSNEPVTVKLSAHGIKKVTAKDFDVPTQIEVINKDLVIANLTSKDAKLEIEATIEKGLGYVPREVLEKDKVGVGVLTLDAIFTPMRRVNYEVENMRVGDRTDYNRLRLSIETDGSIGPRDALKKSINILISQLEALISFEGENEPESAGIEIAKEEVQADESASEDPLKMRIEDLSLSNRTFNALTNAGIRTVGGLVKKSKAELLELQGVGEKAITEIEEALETIHFELKS